MRLTIPLPSGSLLYNVYQTWSNSVHLGELHQVVAFDVKPDFGIYDE